MRIALFATCIVDAMYPKVALAIRRATLAAGAEVVVTLVADPAGSFGERAELLRAAAPDVVLVFGDVGQLQKVGKGTHHGLRRVARQGVEQGGQLGPGGGIAVAGEADGRLAYTLDDLKGGIALLFTDRITQDAAKEADVVAKGFVLVGIERVS